ncbi:hypothetical protein ONS95_000258 [Cadophora gregata]|nr:uncharacterized protein ONS95_000258 [Cadophora gregata]KAK0128283.1 hypothetical protein ONS95_000258 [Cadophora gregata]
MASKTVSISVKYSKPGTQPPIFLAGSFSDPAWQPQEMQYTTDENNEHEFFREVNVEQGKEYQYKFRIGLGEWWILNEDSPTGTDDAGNRNNVLSVPVTDDAIVTKPTEDIPEEDTTKMEEGKHTQPLAAKEVTPEPIESTMSTKEATPEPIEEAMGTRETSDVLFSDEIVKDLEEPKDTSLPMTPEPREPHSTPAHEMEKTKVELVKGNLKDLDDEHTKTKFVQDLEDNKEDNTREAESTESIVPAAAPTPEIGLEQSLPTPPMEAEKLHIEHVKEKTEIDEPSETPTVVVEKVDSTPSHGDDFGPDATREQKDAHNLRAQDAEPDHTVVRKDAHNPEIADIAAEVADTAETLDRDAPTPPISDEEAGRIGYRRMSNTPIPEVAKTAAEVADVAATLDKQNLGDLLEARGYFEIMNDESIVFPETPPHEKVPLFPHESGLSPPKSKESRRHRNSDTQRRASRTEEATVFDPNDPTIQPFPEDREGIMRQLALLQQRLPPDTNDCVGGVDSPISEEIHCPGKPISPGLNIPLQDQSPSLDSITEENDEDQELLPSAENVNGDRLTSLNKVDEAEDNVKEPQVKVNGVKETAEDANKEPIQAEKEIPPIPEILVQRENSKPEPKVDEESKEPLAVVSSQSTEPVLTNPIDRSLDGAEGLEDAEAGIAVGEAATPNAKSDLGHTSDGSTEGLPLPVSPTRIPATPFVVGNRQLGHDEDEVQNISVPSGPNIQVSPATPRGSAVEQNPLDTAKSSAIENNNNQIKSRKQPAKSIPDRPLTPSSMRGKEQSRNFLKAFWRVVFVEWIGGLIIRLCNGGRGRQT